MAQTPTVTREYILSELEKRFVNQTDDMREDEITAEMFRKDFHLQGKEISDTAARRFLRKMLDSGIMTSRMINHHGHTTKVYRYVGKV